MTKKECIAKLKFLDINIVPITKAEYVNHLFKHEQHNKHIPLPRIFMGKTLSYVAELQFRPDENDLTTILFKTYDELINFLENHEL